MLPFPLSLPNILLIAEDEIQFYFINFILKSDCEKYLSQISQEV